MNWTDERYVRVYTRDTTDWLALSCQAQGLFCLLLRKVDRAGLLDLGRLGKVGLAAHIGGPAAWHALEPALEELLADGCVEISGSCLLVRNFIEAQEARQSDKVRQAESRSRRREQVRGARPSSARHDLSQAVTRGHAASPEVTPSCAVPSRTVLSSAVPNAPPPSTSLGTSPSATAATPPSRNDERSSAVHLQREALRAMRTAALPGVVDDVELKPTSLASTFDRLEREATAKGVTVRETYAAFLRDDYARSRNPPCPLPLFVSGNKFPECLSAALRMKGRGPPLTLVSSRKAGGYAALAEIEAQDFTVDPAIPRPDSRPPPRQSSGQAQETP